MTTSLWGLLGRERERPLAEKEERETDDVSLCGMAGVGGGTRRDARWTFVSSSLCTTLVDNMASFPVILVGSIGT